MEENNLKKIPFFTRAKWAIFNLENYDFFAIEKAKVTFAYFIKIIIIFSLLTAIGITYKFATTDFSTIPELKGYLTTETIKYIEQVPKGQLYAIFYSISTIYLFAIYFVMIALDILMLSVLGFITSRIAKVLLRHSAIINISVYALTLPVLLKAIYILVNSFTGFEIKYFEIMYNAVAYIYLVTAILMIKSEMIKQEIELTKLEEEQQKVREELEREQEEERQKEEQKRKEKEEEKKKKDNEEKHKKNKGDSPEGSMAITMNDECEGDTRTTRRV